MDPFIRHFTDHFRKQRGSHLLELFREISQRNVCDLDGSRHFWESVGITPARLTIFNISDLEGPRVEEGVEFVIYDGAHIPAADDQFDLVICNSVLEHVPPKARAALVAEMARVGGQLFCQTPPRSFPIEPHFLMPFVHCCHVVWVTTW